MNRIPISRRHFAELIAAGAAAAFVRPTVSLAKPAVTSTSHGIVRLSANENPYGASPKALQALQDAFPLVCRYPDEHADQLIERLAKMNGVATDQILLGDGSG